MKTITIKVSKYNEIDPTELRKLFENGAYLIKSKNAIGVCLGEYTIDGKMVKVYSDDDIRINNVTLPLSIGATYDHELTINLV